MPVDYNATGDPEPAGDAQPADLRWYIGVFNRHRLALSLCLLLTLAATYAFTRQQTPLYTSQTRVLVKPVGVTNYQYRAEDANMANEVGAAMSQQVAKEVLAEAVVDIDGCDEQCLLAGLDVSSPKDTNFLDFSYTDPDPQRAQELAGAFADAYVTIREESAAEQVKEQLKPLQEELDELMKSIPGIIKKMQGLEDPSKIATLSQSLAYAQGRTGYLRQQILPFKQATTDGGDVVLPPEVPESPSSPSLPLNMGLALVLGLGLGCALALVRERLDDRIRGSRDFERQIGAPVLAIIPKAPGWRRRGDTVLTAATAPRGPVAEAYRTLRTNLQFLSQDGGLKILAVTSAMAGEGKTTTAANLALTLAQTGERIITVSCDLRKPRLHAFFGLTNGVGLTSILTGQETLATAALRVEGVDNLRIVPSGPVPPNPAELLSSRAMKDLIVSLRSAADFVILDTPPVLAVSDSLVLGPACDGVLIIADAQSTSRRAASHTRGQLEQVGAKIIGGALNNFDPSQVSYYPNENPYYYTSSDYYGRGAKSETADSDRSDANGHRDNQADATASDPAQEMWRL